MYSLLPEDTQGYGQRKFNLIKRKGGVLSKYPFIMYLSVGSNQQ